MRVAFGIAGEPGRGRIRTIPCECACGLLLVLALVNKPERLRARAGAGARTAGGKLKESECLKPMKNLLSYCIVLIFVAGGGVTAQNMRVFFGNLHSHTAYSDG